MCLNPRLVVLVIAMAQVGAVSFIQASDRTPHPRQVEIDSLFRAAQQDIDRGDPASALSRLQRAADIDPQDDRPFLKLGEVRLLLVDPEGADRAFRKALSIRLSAEAYDGIGQVLAQGNRVRTRQAIDYFRDALVRDPNYYEGYYHIAVAAWKLKDLDARKAMDEAVRRSPEDTRVYLLLGEWYQYPPADLLRAIQWYERYLQRRPDDVEIAHRLSDLYLRNRQYKEAADQASGLMGRRPDRMDAFPALALAELGQGNLGRADSLFTVYLNRVDPKERACYEDIRFVGTPQEVQAYTTLTDYEQRREFLRRFWAARNPTPAEDGNRRLLEHFRRVYVARTRFSDRQTPWDRRGEVYIRYGEPDYRSRSDEIDFTRAIDPRVERIKQNLRMAIYGSAVPFPVTDTQDLNSFVDDGAIKRDEKMMEGNALNWGPVYPIRSWSGLEEDKAGTWSTHEIQDTGGGTQTQMKGAEERRGSRSIGDTPDNAVPWESWIYFYVGGGIEITFTDERMDGRYDYAPVPLDIPLKDVKINLVTNSPQAVLQKAAARMPEYFRQETPGHLVFSACPASFRGDGGKTRVEVYTALPVSEIGYTRRDTGRIASLERRIALLDTAWLDAGRMRGELTLSDSVTAGVGKGAFLLGVRTFDVDPGDYVLAVQMTDRATGRMQAYRQKLSVDRFGTERLQISDLELAAQILPDAGPHPLVKNGLRVLPMPSRTFAPDQSLFLYYEVYNLTRDPTGQTRYRVEYTVRSKGGTVGANLFSAFGRLIRKEQRKGETSVSYEFLGLRAEAYLHLEMAITDIGIGDYALRVAVTDLNQNRRAERETTFWIQK